MTYSTADEGFSIIELLVAIAITSFVVLAIGGLLTLGLRVKERVDENAAVQTALIDLQGLAVIAASEVGFALATMGERGFTLLRKRAAEPPVVWTVELRTERGKSALELDREQRTSAVSLAAFDAVMLEYLAPGSGAPSWVAARAGAPAALAVRLKLERGQRVWRPLIWIASSLEVVEP